MHARILLDFEQFAWPTTTINMWISKLELALLKNSPTGSGLRSHSSLGVRTCLHYPKCLQVVLRGIDMQIVREKRETYQSNPRHFWRAWIAWLVTQVPIWFLVIGFHGAFGELWEGSDKWGTGRQGNSWLLKHVIVLMPPVFLNCLLKTLSSVSHLLYCCHVCAHCPLWGDMDQMRKTTHLKTNGRSDAPCCRTAHVGLVLGWNRWLPQQLLAGLSYPYSACSLPPKVFSPRSASENSTTQFCW